MSDPVMKLYLAYVVLVINVGIGFGIVPPMLQKVLCPQNSPNMSECFIRAIETIRPQLISGDYGNGVKGISLDPYDFSLKIKNGEDFEANVKDAVITGVRDFQILSLNAQMSKNKVSAMIRFPNSVIRGQHTLKMILGPLLQINGRGSFNVTDDPTVELTMEFAVDKSNAGRFLPVKMTIYFNDPVLYLSGMFPNNPVMDGMVNTFLNANPEVLLNQITPALERNLAGTITQIANTIVQGTKMDELFP